MNCNHHATQITITLFFPLSPSLFSSLFQPLPPTYLSLPTYIYLTISLPTYLSTYLSLPIHTYLSSPTYFPISNYQPISAYLLLLIYLYLSFFVHFFLNIIAADTGSGIGLVVNIPQHFEVPHNTSLTNCNKTKTHSPIYTYSMKVKVAYFSPHYIMIKKFLYTFLNP